MIPIELKNDDLLQYAVSKGIINLEDVRNSMRKQENERLLGQHKYRIFFDEKDKRWKTTLPDESKKNRRRLIAKRSRENLEDAIISFYRTKEAEMEQHKQEEKITLRELFPEWLIYKNCHTTATSYIYRIKSDWNKYYENDDIIDIPIKNLTYLQLDTWAHNMVKEYELTKKQYYNMSTIMRQSLEYAVEKYNNIIKISPFERVKVNSRLFAKHKKPDSETQVFTKADEKEICKLALNKYYKRPKSISGLAIVLNFNLGLRVGELVALRWCDINDNYIHIQRMEVADYDIDNKGNVLNKRIKIVEHTKSFAGDRKVYLNQNALNILSIIKKRNISYELCDGDYIFVSDHNQRLKSNQINHYLYRLCDEMNIGRKSSHKIRKTYISTLFDEGLNINKIREIAGHEDERTSLHNYCFDRNEDEDTENLLETITPDIKITEV